MVHRGAWFWMSFCDDADYGGSLQRAMIFSGLILATSTLTECLQLNFRIISMGLPLSCCINCWQYFVRMENNDDDLI